MTRTLPRCACAAETFLDDAPLLDGAMAKKPKKTEAEQESDADGAAPEKPAGGRRKLIVIVAGVLVLAGSGAGGFVFMRGKGKEADVMQEKKFTGFVDIKEMTVNLAPSPQQERVQYLKLKVALEVGDPRLMGQIQPLLPRIEDTFQVYMRELRASDLEGSAGVYRLKEELLRRVNLAVYPSRVDAVLFKEIVVQ